MSNDEDFIIPDVEEATPTPQQGTKSSKPTESSRPSINQQSSSGWRPTVNLSAFTPFISSGEPTQGTKIKERQYTGGDTLDEPVLHTLKRDLVKIAKRLAIVIWPMQLSKLARKQQLKLIDIATNNGIQLPQLVIDRRRISVSEYDEEDTTGGNDSATTESLDWDLWGPLIFSLAYSTALGFSDRKQANQVFSGSFSYIWIFYLVIGLNIQLLGGNISFMSAISATGYSMFPIAMGEIICSLFLKWKLIRLAIVAILDVWSIYSAMMSLKCSGVLPGRVFLAMYPVGLMYTVLSWLVVIT